MDVPPILIPAAQSVGISELVEVVRTENYKIAELSHLTEQIISALDYDQGGNVSISEFKHAMTTQPLLAECFNRTSIPRLVAVKPEWQDFMRSSKFTLPDLIECMKLVRRKDARHLHKEMTRDEFFKFCHKEFGTGKSTFRGMV